MKQSFYKIKDKSQLSGVTLMELVVVIIIIGILAATTIPQYNRSREKTHDKQAQVILSSIRAAERMYWVENGYHYTTGGAIVSVANINSNLSLDLADDGDWVGYKIESNAGFNASISRNKAGYKRTWYITVASENATCSGPSCP